MPREYYYRYAVSLAVYGALLNRCDVKRAHLYTLTPAELELLPKGV